MAGLIISGASGMKERIARSIEFTADEIVEALVLYRKERNRPAPDSTATDRKFSIHKAGATLSWTEEIEFDLPKDTSHGQTPPARPEASPQGAAAAHAHAGSTGAGANRVQPGRGEGDAHGAAPGQHARADG